MKNNKQYDDMLREIGSALEKVTEMNKKELPFLTSLVDEIINKQSQDIPLIESLLNRLFDLMLFGVGEDLYNNLLGYLSSFNLPLAQNIKELNKELLGEYDQFVEEAKLLAQTLHTGQTDKAGIDYFLGHLTAVGESGCTWKDKIVGYLHDVAEDTEYSVEQIVKILQTRCNNEIPEQHLFEIRDALELLNSKTAQTREEYISRIRNSKIATRVKLNDLKHNMDISRIPEPDAKDMERLKRYKKEYRTILEYLGPVSWNLDDLD